MSILRPKIGLKTNHTEVICKKVQKKSPIQTGGYKLMGNI